METHLIISPWGGRTLEHETPYTVDQVRSMASVVHSSKDQGASISSGSFHTDGMIIAPCSMKSAAAIAHGLGSDLLARAADVVLKEQRRLVLMTRESPLSAIHLRNLLTLAERAVTVLLPMPAFYNRPGSLDELIDHIVVRALDQFGFSTEGAQRWDGQMGRMAAEDPAGEISG